MGPLLNVLEPYKTSGIPDINCRMVAKRRVLEPHEMSGVPDLRVITPNSLTLWSPMKGLVSQTAAKVIDNERLFGKRAKHLPP